MNAQELAATLDTPSGFATVLRGMFRNGKARKANALWSAAARKGVYDTTELRFATHESFGYAVMAFSVTGPLDLPTRETLAGQAERSPLGTIRYESASYSALEPLGWHPRSYDPNDHSVNAIGDPFPGVYVFTAVTSPKGADRPFVAHCVVDGKDYIYPVPGDRLR